jgi:indole-3-glycerol phosphate synthase
MNRYTSVMRIRVCEAPKRMIAPSCCRLGVGRSKHRRVVKRDLVRCSSGARRNDGGGDDDDDDDVSKQESRLGSIVRRKKEDVERKLRELGEEALEDRLTSATMSGPGENPFPFSQKVSTVSMKQGRPLLIFEVARDDETGTSEDLADRAKRLVEAGADAISVRIDEACTPEGEKDLFMVSRACSRDVPVFARDWFLHPLQIVDARSAGATGIIGIVASITSRGSPVLSSFGAALGLDCPVEVVNLEELKLMEGFGVPFYCMDIQVGISVKIAGFNQNLISGVLSELPFGSLSIVGVSSVPDVPERRQTGADALYLKHDLVKLSEGKELEFVSDMLSMVDGD